MSASHPQPAAGWQFDNSYARLPEAFFSPSQPEKAPRPQLVLLNEPLCLELGLDPEFLASAEGVEMLVGNQPPIGSQPIAQAYAGHQYAHFTMLGDGRAILMGEHIAPDGRRWDIQWKGSGRTAYSRRGDGKAALAPMLREYVISEAMHALGIPTTRSLAVCTTGETVFREQELPGAVLVRVAASHIRVGTFEYTRALDTPDLLQALLDHTLQRHAPELAEAENPALAFLEECTRRQARLIAQWMHVGFVHGVMNTDNMALSGETIDYGPCAFMDAYDPATVFSSIDRGGRYAYGQQPGIAQWNLARLAETLLPLIDPDEQRAIAAATNVLEDFPKLFHGHSQRGLAAKLGWSNPGETELALLSDLLAAMHDHRADFTNTFAALATGRELPPTLESALTDWQNKWAATHADPVTARQLMQSASPAVIPRNHHVEAALRAASDHSDLTLLRSLLDALQSPYDHTLDRAAWTAPSPDGGRGYRTFCGT